MALKLCTPTRMRVEPYRVPITAWRLLIWAYRIQLVHYDVGWYEAGIRETDVPLSDFDNALGHTFERNRTAQRDAYIVHAAVKDLRSRDHRSVLISTAAVRQRPDWNPEIVPMRIVPDRWPSGRLRMLRDSGRRELACRIKVEGVPQEEADLVRQEARDRYSTWWHALREVRASLRAYYILERFAVTDVGAPRTPWA